VEALKYRVVTTGEIHAGFTLQEVKRNLSGLCKNDKDKLERIFSTDLFVFESDIDLITARRHKSSLDQTGIVCLIEPLTPIVLNQKPIDDTQPAQSTTTHSELSVCPKCGVSYNGEAVCASCGILPAKYLERQRLEQQVKAIPAEEGKGSGRIIRVAVLLVVGAALVSTAYLLPKNFKHDLSDRLVGLKAPNFDHPLNKFHENSQSDIIREYNARGFTLTCYGNLRPEERVSSTEDYVCWMPIKSAYNNIPARMVTFFFSQEKLNHVRLEFPDSSSDQVQEYLGKKLSSERRLDMLPQYRARTNIYGEPLMIWDVKGGVIQTPAKATPGQLFMVLWTRREEGSLSRD